MYYFTQRVTLPLCQLFSPEKQQSEKKRHLGAAQIFERPNFLTSTSALGGRRNRRAEQRNAMYNNAISLRRRQQAGTARVRKTGGEISC